MYIVLLTYIRPLEEVDLVLPDHVEWLGKQYEAGYFLVSGRKVPREGAVIIARPMPRGKLEALLATDPFAAGRLAKYEIVEFQATRTVPELARLNEAIPA
jgi:uncharacterized protein YciI